MTAATKARPAMVFAFCSGGTHDRCPGVVTDKNRTWCSCGCHDETPRCATCRSSEAVDPATRECVDTDGCAATLEVRHLASPIHQQLESVMEHAVRVRAAQRAAAEVRAAMTARREAQADDGATGGHNEPPPARTPRVPREPRAPRTPQRCHCGCGGTTKGGLFVAGHDMKLKGALKRACEAERDADQGGFLDAAAELVARGWDRGRFADLAQVLAHYTDQQGDAQTLIAARVAARYGS